MDDFIECEPLGNGTFDESSNKTFYTGVSVHGMRIYRQNYVKVRTEEEKKATISYGQVLAIYEDHEDDHLMMIEIRWFLVPAEVRLTRKRRIETYANELYESTDVQDIPAGAITLQIDIKDCDEQLETFESKKTNKGKGSKEENIFYCRFLCTEAMDSLLPVETSDIWKRSLRYSDYSHIYSASFPQEEPTQDASSYDPYSIAIAQLHVSFIPDTMPCRQDEHRKILDFLTKQLSQTSSSKKVTHGKSKAKGQKSNQSSSDQTENARASGGSEPLYLSGMTGTGKTATVFASLTSLSKLKEELSLPDYSFIEINGLRLSSPQEAYSLLWKGISGEQVAPRTALQRLKEYFSVRKIGNEGNDPLKENEDGSDEYYICLLDELDFLITSNEAVIYNILDWSQSKNSGLILIGIANTMDLPDRLSKKSQSRMGGAFRRISFRPYTFDQILQILTDRLQNLHGIFEGKILELVARKAAACSGDLRSALKICQRAIELHRDQQTDRTVVSPVSLQMVTRAATEYRENPLMIATRYACDLDICIFLALSKHAKNTGVSSLSLLELWEDTQNIISSVGVHGSTGTLICPPWPVFKEAICRLLDQGLLLASDRPNVVAIGTFNPDDRTKFQTNLSFNDVLVALRDGKNKMTEELFPTIISDT